MRSFFSTSVLFLSLIVVGASAAAVGGETKVEVGEKEVKGTWTIDNPVYTELLECREKKGNGLLEHARCYEKAASLATKNISIHSSLSLLYLKADLPMAAKRAMNQTISLWLNEAADKHIKEEEQGKVGYIDLLRRAYDEARDKNDTEAQNLVIEMGMVLAKKFELEHKPTDAHGIYYGFLAQLGVGMDNMIDFHRRTGNVVALTHTQRSNVSLGFRIAEALPAIVEGLTAHLMSYGTIAKDSPIKRMCGTVFKHGSNDEIFGRDLVEKVMECVKNWGNYTLTLEQEDPSDRVSRVYDSLKLTPLHRMAFMNAAYLLKETLDYLEEKHDKHVNKLPVDRYGRGLLHYAAGGAAPDSIKVLMDKGARVDAEDAGKVQPANLGCTVPKFKDHYEEAAGEDTCLGLRRNVYIDEDIEITDDTGTDAGWNPKKLKNPPMTCEIDIRDMAKTYQADVNLQHLMVNYPVVLRNAFFEEDDGPRREWSRKIFNKTFHNILVKKEVSPNGEKYGIGEAKPVTVSDFLNSSKINDGTIASVVVDNTDHKMESVAGWIPPSLVNRKNGATEVLYFNVNTSSPTLVLNKKGSKAHHRLYTYPHFHTVFYGHQEFTLLPPHHARTVRGQLNDVQKEHSLRCNLHTGDVLVLPEMWSSSWVSHANGFSVERMFYRREAQD